MLEDSFLTANLVLAYSAYALGTASPGPSNLSVMATAMHHGRRSGLIFALGVVSGSTVWGLLAAFGLSTILAQYSQALIAMKILGGLYLLWLAFKAAKSAMKPADFSDETGIDLRRSAAGYYLQGAAIHLTNPKAIFVWLSIVALALPASSSRIEALLVVGGCIPIGVAVFCSYALIFSTMSARRAYLRTHRWFDGALAVLFGYAGIRMLASRAAV
jgi:threonine efflux protein